MQHSLQCQNVPISQSNSSFPVLQSPIFLKPILFRKKKKNGKLTQI